MSFYGNSYYYTAESFARIVLKNSGLNVHKKPDINFDSEAIYLDAGRRESGLGVENGNQWIGLSVNDAGDGFKIWHNKPSTEIDDENANAAQTFKIVTESDIPLGADIQNFGFDDYIEIPYIEYDDTGHVITTKSACYFKAMSDPTENFNERLDSVETRMNAIDGLDNNPDTTSLNYQLNTRMDGIEETVGEYTDDIATANSNANSALDKAGEALDTAKKATNDVTNIANNFKIYASQISDLLDRVTKLEQK